jgi:hypothetical protein
MLQDRTNQEPTEGQTVENNDTPQQNESADRFESDTQKIVRMHMEDEDHVISEQDMQNIRVGMTPSNLDEATEARFGDDDTVEDAEEEVLGEDVDDIKEEENSSDDSVTPWDTIDPK